VTLYPWYLDPYPLYFDSPTHGISYPLSMVFLTPLPVGFWPPYLCYIDPLPMVLRPSTHGI
jgi:hypothetical protein